MAATMAAPESSKRPKLSLQTKPAPGPSVRSSRPPISNVYTRSPTAFNTLSNVYVTAIERSTPTRSTPRPVVNFHQPLKLQTDTESLNTHQARVVTPHTTTLPDTPMSANPLSPAQKTDMIFPSTITSTPPLSAGPVESSESSSFMFPPTDTNRLAYPRSPAHNRRRMIYAQLGFPSKAPYSVDRSLRSILRNSPLPPTSAVVSPNTQRRQSRRLQEKADRRVGYLSPLTQTITNEKYTKSHIDLLVDDASPYTTTPVAEDSDIILDLAMAYTGDETRDGGETPGPFEEMRRRMTGLGTASPTLSPKPEGVRKRKKKEKNRKWVWTIGQDDEENESGAIAALKAAVGDPTTIVAAPTSAPVPILVSMPTKAALRTSLRTVRAHSAPAELQPDTSTDQMDIDMFDISDASSQVSSAATTPQSSVDMAMKTPVIVPS